MSYDDFDGVLGGDTSGSAKVVKKITDDKINGLVGDLAPKAKTQTFGGYRGGWDDLEDDEFYTSPRGVTPIRHGSGNNYGSTIRHTPALSHISTPILLNEGVSFVPDTHPNVSDSVYAKFTQAQWSQMVDNLMYDIEKTLKDEASLVASVPFGRDQIRRELSKFLFDNFKHEDKTGKRRFLDVNGVRK
jgi:hypothetical protein